LVARFVTEGAHGGVWKRARCNLAASWGNTRRVDRFGGEGESPSEKTKTSVCVKISCRSGTFRLDRRISTWAQANQGVDAARPCVTSVPGPTRRNRPSYGNGCSLARPRLTRCGAGVHKDFTGCGNNGAVRREEREERRRQANRTECCGKSFTVTGCRRPLASSGQRNSGLQARLES
jgi:hypothetical protein